MLSQRLKEDLRDFILEINKDAECVCVLYISDRTTKEIENCLEIFRRRHLAFDNYLNKMIFRLGNAIYKRDVEPIK